MVGGRGFLGVVCLLFFVMIVEGLPNSTWTYLAQFFMGFVSLLAYWKLRSSFRESGVETLGYFSRFFGLFALFMFVMGAPFLVPEVLSGVQLGAFYIFGHLFLYGSLAFLVLVPLQIYRPGLKVYGFWLTLLGGGVVSFVNVLFWNRPVVEKGVVLNNVGFPVGPLIGVLVALTMLSAGVFFVKQAWSRSGLDRWKFLFLALGMVLITVGGPLHDNAVSVWGYVVADVLTVAGLLFTLSGVYVEWVFEKLGREV